MSIIAMNEKTDIPCFDCEGGYYEIQKLPYEAIASDGTPFVYHDIPHHVCPVCASAVLGWDATTIIDSMRCGPFRSQKTQNEIQTNI